MRLPRLRFARIFSKKILSSYFSEKLRPFQRDWIFLVSLALILSGSFCASFCQYALLSLMLVYSALAFLLVLFFDLWGLIFSFVNILFLTCCVFYSGSLLTFEFIWNLGMVCAFSLTWFVFFLWTKSSKEQSGKKQESIKNLIDELSSLKNTYEEEKARLLEGNKELSIQLDETNQNFGATKEDLEELKKKYSYLEVDFRILSEQKDSWLEDYAILHREYVQISDRLEMLTAGGASLSNEEKSCLQKKDEENQRLIESLEKQLSLKENAFFELSQKQKDWMKEKSSFEEINQQLAKDIEGLKNLLDRKESEVCSLQEKIDALKQQLVSESEVKRPKEVTVLEAKVDCQALYHQLKLQFAEKDAVLSSVRKEFFLLKEKLLERERMEELSLGEENFEELRLIEHLTSEIALLEEEVTLLEGLVSRILLQ
ncbi:hypothetical protein [Chlamydiifrater phoenicopteri]|uniref:hypothetical protein n=1 Tax=Chlamydiifrater phoenicopteri TaxID=2681469 RepID=UPI001BCB442A|nr:hypothetical protein [Chlamydiifrater phoenicopteri]